MYTHRITCVHIAVWVAKHLIRKTNKARKGVFCMELHRSVSISCSLAKLWNIGYMKWEWAIWQSSMKILV